MNILFIGGHRWNGTWFRKQQFASRLSQRGHRVFYIEDSISIMHWNRRSKNHPYKIKIERINDNLFIITPPTFFPFPSNQFLRTAYNLMFFYKLRKLLKNYDAKDYILWFNRMEYSTYLKQIKGLKIFDLCDDLPGYSLLAKNQKVYNQQMYYLTKALERCDISIVSAEKIREKYNNLTKSSMYVIPNGHNINSKGNQKPEWPSDLENIPKPIIGFIGTLFQFIDDELLEYVISRKPEYSFVFIGNLEDTFPIEKLKKYKNVYLLGRKPQNEISSYIQGFNVCINPFKVHEVNDSVNPVKVFEYLAGRKFVLSSIMYSLMREEIADYICFADSKTDFVNKLDLLVKKETDNNIPSSILDHYHWDNLFLRLLNKVNSDCRVCL